MDGCPTFARAYVGRKRRGDPDFLHAVPTMFACAAFVKESRMKFANATEVNRKFGVAPPSLYSFSLKRRRVIG
jgi:hypothetical protein